MNRSFTCLLIEDDPDDQEIFLIALRESFPRATCWVASSCHQALDRMMHRLAPVPDYIFMDWNLPQIYGEECIRLIRNSGLQNVCLFVISGSHPPLSVTSLERLGIKEVIEKQSSIQELSKELHNVIKAY